MISWFVWWCKENCKNKNDLCDGVRRIAKMHVYKEGKLKWFLDLCDGVRRIAKMHVYKEGKLKWFLDLCDGVRRIAKIKMICVMV
jgi:hypothetical protein